jgi:protein SCO1/2
MFRHFIFSLFFLLTVETSAHAALFTGTTADLQAEAKAAARQHKLLAVFLTMPDCPGCLDMERHVHPDPATEKAFGKRFRTVQLDILQHQPLIDAKGQTTTPAQLAQRLRAIATPSYIFFDAQGQLLYRYTGTLDKTAFRQLGDYVTKGEYENRPFIPAIRTGQQAGESSLRLNAEALAATVPIHPEFTLAATDGNTYRIADFRGVALALAVGYTQCPDVCPTTLAELKAAVEALPTDLRKQVQILFVTLDPERDSLALLNEYAEHFRPTGGRPILGLRGDTKQTADFIRQLQLVADKQPSASMGYTLDHTAGVFLFAPDGRLLGLSPYGQPLKDLAADLKILAADARSSAAHHLAKH